MENHEASGVRSGRVIASPLASPPRKPEMPATVMKSDDGLEVFFNGLCQSLVVSLVAQLRKEFTGRLEVEREAIRKAHEAHVEKLQSNYRDSLVRLVASVGVPSSTPSETQNSAATPRSVREDAATNPALPASSDLVAELNAFNQQVHQKTQKGARSQIQRAQTPLNFTSPAVAVAPLPTPHSVTTTTAVTGFQMGPSVHLPCAPSNVPAQPQIAMQTGRTQSPMHQQGANRYPLVQFSRAAATISPLRGSTRFASPIPNRITSTFPPQVSMSTSTAISNLGLARSVPVLVTGETIAASVTPASNQVTGCPVAVATTPQSFNVPVQQIPSGIATVPSTQGWVESPSQVLRSTAPSRPPGTVPENQAMPTVCCDDDTPKNPTTSNVPVGVVVHERRASPRVTMPARSDNANGESEGEQIAIASDSASPSSEPVREV